ncbi:glycosyltransferase [Flavobacterium sp. J372]|uniref:CgeB family protein n=1 Tax=Flavobacterium sp. J372 TaxID=2898436 RepID=UPI00215181CA|nr:glycosyltransferase [Flavobacterium sp. J372]MCR5862041.1 glycosyltransferase [Flavobacterium sp. J372]
MKIIMFYHSLASDWNHGNAHFLRGIVTELLHRGHDVRVYEETANWSLSNLINDHGIETANEFRAYYPNLRPHFYDADNINLRAVLNNADLVIVHEWNRHDLVAKIGALKPEMGYKLLFHDTHHRAVSDAESMSQYNFTNYDGALVFGEVLRKIYDEKKWFPKTWTWHEAADTKLFKPRSGAEKEGDLVWIGNWGDGERTEELKEFLIEPVKKLGLKAKVFGVRYPEEALAALKEAGIEYGGWLPNYKAPGVFAKYKVTVHVPRGPYVKTLPGIPTIRPFEAMACGIPLISAPWEDAEKLFTPGKDFLTANCGDEMVKQLQAILFDEGLADEVAGNALQTIISRHTCAHRVDDLEEFLTALGIEESLLFSTKIKQEYGD